MLYEQISGATFQASPYRRPVVGWMSDLDAMTPQDAREFFQRWYVPANAVVVIAGDVDPQQVRAWSQKYYGSIPARPVPAAQAARGAGAGGHPPHRVQGAGRAVVRGAGLQGAAAAPSMPAPRTTTRWRSPCWPPCSMATSGARLDRALTQGPTAWPTASAPATACGAAARSCSRWTACRPPGKTPEQVEAALRAEVARVAREGVTEAELQRVKTRWIAGEIYKLDSVMNQARELGSAWIHGLPLDADERLIERLRGVTAAQVKAVAAKYFGDDQLTVGMLRPLPLDPNRKPRTPAAGAAPLRPP
jgi:zinc protease